MDARGYHYLTRDAEDFLDEVFQIAVSRGYRYVVPFSGSDIGTPIVWLRARGIDFFDQIGVFGFRDREAAETFRARFAP